MKEERPPTARSVRSRLTDLKRSHVRFTRAATLLRTIREPPIPPDAPRTAAAPVDFIDAEFIEIPAGDKANDTA